MDVLWWCSCQRGEKLMFRISYSCVYPYCFLQISRNFGCFSTQDLLHLFLSKVNPSQKRISVVSEALFLVILCWLPVLLLCCFLKSCSLLVHTANIHLSLADKQYSYLVPAFGVLCWNISMPVFPSGCCQQ